VFKCDVGGHPTEPRVPMVKVVLEVRNVEYADGSTGSEIVREGKLCPDHAAEIRSMTEEIAAATAELQEGALPSE
jgi:hypothetical protein